MHELLKELQKSDREMSFLFPALGDGAFRGKVVDLKEDKVTLLGKVNGEATRIVTHPNSVVMVERT